MDEEEQKAFEEQQNRDYQDEQERKQFQDFKVGTRKTPLSNNILNLLNSLLQPQTTGFKQVNMDMAFTYLDRWDIDRVMNYSFLVTFFEINELPKSEYMQRGELATFLNAKRSQDGKSMELFTTTITKQDQSYADKTEKKTGFFSKMGLGKKEKQ